MTNYTHPVVFLYYNSSINLAELVDPYSVDEIGNAILKCMEKDISNSDMLNFMRDNYSLEACSKKIIDALNNVK